MGLNYQPLWHILIEKQLKKTDLLTLAHLSPATLAKLSKNLSVDGKTIAKICEALSCQPGDIVQYVSDEKVKKPKKN